THPERLIGACQLFQAPSHVHVIAFRPVLRIQNDELPLIAGMPVAATRKLVHRSTPIATRPTRKLGSIHRLALAIFESASLAINPTGHDSKRLNVSRGGINSESVPHTKLFAAMCDVAELLRDIDSPVPGPVVRAQDGIGLRSRNHRRDCCKSHEGDRKLSRFHNIHCTFSFMSGVVRMMNKHTRPLNCSGSP